MQNTPSLIVFHMRRFTPRRTARIVPKPVLGSSNRKVVPAIRATVSTRVTWPLVPHPRGAGPRPGARPEIGLPVFFNTKYEV